MKDDKCVGMEIDDTIGGVDCCDDQNDDLRRSSDVVGMDVDPKLKEQVCGDHENGVKMSSEMIVANLDSGRGDALADENRELFEGSGNGSKESSALVVEEPGLGAVCSTDSGRGGAIALEKVESVEGCENGLKGNIGSSIENQDVEAVPTNVADENRVVVEAYENGSKLNGGMSVGAQDSKVIRCTDSERASSIAYGKPESDVGCADALSCDSTKEAVVKCNATFTSTSCYSSEPVLSCSTEVLEPTSSQNKNVDVQVVSMENASANKDETVGGSDLVTYTSLGVESVDGIQKSDEKANMDLPVLETDVADASITGSVVTDSDAVPAAAPQHDSNEVLEDHPVQHSSFSDELHARCVNSGPECEPDGALKAFHENAISGAARIDTNVEDAQETHDQDVNDEVSVAETMEAESDAGLRHEANTHEQQHNPDESLDTCDRQQIECELPISVGCELGTSAGGCLDKNVTSGNAQHGSEGDIQAMEKRVDNDEQVVSMDAPSARDEYITEPYTSVPDKHVLHGDHGVGEKLDTSTILEKAEVPKDLVDVSDVMISDPASELDKNEEDEGHVAHDQPSLVDEVLVGGSDQQADCDPDPSVGECLVKSTTDVTPNDINMKDIQEVQEAVSPAQYVESPEEVTGEGSASDLEEPQSLDEENAISGSSPTQQVESLEEQVDEDPVSDSSKPGRKDEKYSRRGSAKTGSLVSNHWVTYQLQPEDDEGDFSVFDLVWGKVKSHPWWPGQIFHPSDSSEKAKKYYKKDSYLVAYFGDRSFAWNDASVLKPFCKHFSQEEKQSSTESFQNAVKCALAEVSRRLELGLACSCISDAAYGKIRYQIVQNGGIREESSKREGVDRSTGPDTFHTDKFVEYVRALAISPTGGVDRLDVTVAKAQLLAFNRLKGCDALAEFQYYDGLAEIDADNSLTGGQEPLCENDHGDLAAGDDTKTRLKGPRKRKHNLKDIVYQRRKEKSLTELMGESMYYLDGEFDSHDEDDMGLTSPTSSSKRKYHAGDFTAQPSTKTISFAKVSHTASSNPQQSSFKVGECIRRVASQLTGSPSILKSASDGSDSKVIGDDVDEVIDAPDDSVTESTIIPKKESLPEDLLSQLHLSALDPMKGYSFLGDITSFFYEFRNMAVSAQRQKMRKGPGRKRKPSVPAVGSPEAFEFDDRNDSYWTDMVVQNNSEAKPARRGRKRKENQIAAVDSEKPPRSTRRKYSRKQYFHGNLEPAAEVEAGAEIPSGDGKQDNLPAELMMSFGESGCIPSEVNLNKMFRCFGPLKESETEIDAHSSRARVVFKKRSDAAVAYSSATMFNIFGSTLVNYQLNSTPSVSLGTPPLQLGDTVEHET